MAGERSRPTSVRFGVAALLVVLALVVVGVVVVVAARDDDGGEVTLRPEVTLAGPLFGVADAVVQLDDGRVAVGNENLWLLDPGLPTNLPPEEIRRYDEPVRALAVLGGDRLASAAPGERITLWDLSGSVEEIGTLDGHEATVTSLVTLDDELLASGDADGTVRIWRLTAGADTVLGGHAGAVVAMAALDDGGLISVAEDGVALVWDVVAPGVGPVVFDEHDAPLLAVQPLDDGRVATMSVDGVVLVWDPSAPNGPALRLEALDGSDGSVDGASPLTVVGGRLAATGVDGVARVWDLSVPETSAVLLATGADGPVAVLGIDDELLVTGTDGGRLLLWDLGRPDEPVVGVDAHDGAVRSAHPLREDRFASVGADGRVRVWGVG